MRGRNRIRCDAWWQHIGTRLAATAAMASVSSCVVNAVISVGRSSASTVPGCEWWTRMGLRNNAALIELRMQCTHCGSGLWWSPEAMQCVPTLGCSGLAALQPHALLGAGGVKRLDRATLIGRNVTLSTALNPNLSDFEDGVTALLDLNERPGGGIVPLLGHCDHPPMMLTPFYPLGSADQLDSLLDRMTSVSAEDRFLIRLKACESYLNALMVLHGETKADAIPRILCDAREGPRKLLSQFLIADESGQLVLNDVDAAPPVSSLCATPIGELGAKCGHRQFSKQDFVAPEMLWPYPNESFSDAKMHCYTEKVDIWRIPETLSFLLGHEYALPFSVALVFRQRLDALSNICKYPDHRQRPSASWVLGEFLSLSAPVRASLNIKDPDF